MKIGPSTPMRLVGVTPEARSGAKEGGSAPAGGESGGQAVNLSELSRTLSAMESSLGDGSVDMQRVAGIKAAIRNGDFKVDANAVAEGLVRSVEDMLAGPTGK